LEFMEIWNANSGIILTGRAGIILFFILTGRPWEKLAVAFTGFHKIDHKVSVAMWSVLWLNTILIRLTYEKLGIRTLL
jgi:hypothetical protein